MVSCNGTPAGPSPELIKQMNLKRGTVISCGNPDGKFGIVEFDMTCSEKVKNDFNLAIELLHSFEYDESEKVFAKVIDAAPDCAMAYWGVAMCNFHPLWNPPTEPELMKGTEAINIANNIKKKSAREAGYINAIAQFYNNHASVNHHMRCVSFEKAMEQLHTTYPSDKEAAIFYALALDAAAEPTDKTFAHQKKAAALLNALYPAEPNHPGIIHYIIHTYDYPGLAALALPAAKKYAAVAPSSAHALHMPSHIFTRLGLWDDCIQSNLLSVNAAKCYADAAGIKGHWEEELHGLDYLVYAYLQKGDNASAQEQVKYVADMKLIVPLNSKVAYALAAIPSRFFLENKKWKEAASTPLHPLAIWQQFPWQAAMVHFARVMGAIHIKNNALADSEMVQLTRLYDTLNAQKDGYKAHQLAVQIKTATAWQLLYAGKKSAAITSMALAADMEDSTEKSPVTPGEILPARELLGDMLLQVGQYQQALNEYETILKKSPNRFNSLFGAGMAAQKMGNRSTALTYYQQLVAITATNSTRPELVTVRDYFTSTIVLNRPATE